MMNDTIVKFEDYLILNKKSSNTVTSYINDISRFCTYFNGEVTALTNSQIISYIALLQDSGKSEATIRRFISALKTYYSFLNSIKINCMACTEALKAPPYQSKLPKILSLSEVDLLLSQPDLNSPKGLRDKAMLELLYATGLRINELVSINITDVNATLGSITRENNQIIALYPSSQKALYRYISEGRPILINNTDQTAPVSKSKWRALILARAFGRS